MRILAIESSSVTASVAIVTDDILTAEYTINHKKTHSQTLLPMIDEICSMTETDMDTFDIIAVSSGPGSFTGLRIGASTGKGLGLALDIPIVSVPTLDAMAYNMYGCDKLICPMLDARRANVYTGLYTFQECKNKTMKILIAQCLISIEKLVDKINEIGKEVIFLGDGTAVAKAIIEENITVKYEFAPPNISSQKAASVAVLGKLMFEEGKAINAREHLPDYIRPSQAERELNDKMSGQ